MAQTIACFGEIILRLSTPGREQLLQSGRLDAWVGGAEANVAVGLSRLGTPSQMVTVLPDNALGHAARDELRRNGVATEAILWSPQGRLALYFLTVGAMLRPSDITYDREGSAFAEAAPELVDWSRALEGVGTLHVSGITAATGPNGAAAALRALEAANAAGVTVSFDCNFRQKMWERWGGDSAGTIRALMAQSDIIFGDERDFAMALNQPFFGEGEAALVAAADAAFEAFPRLKLIACTRRAQESVDDQTLSAVLARRGTPLVHARAYRMTGVVDRIGGGDAFVAGLLHAMGQGRDDQAALDFALAAGVLKHSVPGDFNLVSEADVMRLVANEGLHVRR